MSEPYWEPLAAAPPTPSAMTLLWDSVVAGVALPVATITTPALDQSYTHLRIIAQLLSSNSNNGGNLLRFNGDAAGGHYYWEQLQVHGTTIAGVEGIAANEIACGNAGGYITPLDILIPSYSVQTGAGGKSAIAKTMFVGVLGSGSIFLQDTVGLWQVNQAISTVSLINGISTWAAGTRLSVYGIK